jgi:hypothetical protein
MHAMGIAELSEQTGNAEMMMRQERGLRRGRDIP